MIDDLRAKYEGKPMESAADGEFKKQVFEIQSEVVKQTALWKIFMVIMHHPLDFTMYIRKYTGGNIQLNQLKPVRFRPGLKIRTGGRGIVPST